MTNHKLPIIALVGPPNAGKSTLLNKIIGERLAVTSAIAHTTRDRQFSQTSFMDKSFRLVDTAGLDLSAQGELEANVQKQIEIALKEADAIILVVDGKQPTAAIDRTVLSKFRKLKKPKILAVNKLDSGGKRSVNLAEFASLGIKPMFGLSAVTGSGIGDMLEYIVATLLATPASKHEEAINEAVEIKNHEDIKVAIVGKPNVGKSSLFNKILNAERAVVSSVPGTTRTSIDDEITFHGVSYTFIDTAGLKRKEHRQAQADIFSGFQTFKSIRKSDVCFFMIDSLSEITSQDKRIAQEIFQMQKGCVIVASKIDAYDGKIEALRDYVSHHFPFLWMCPVFFVSALSGEGLQDALKAIKPIYDRRNKKIDDKTVSEFLARVMKQQPPKRLWDQKNPRVFSLRQIDISPPTFELIVNFPAAISQHFRHFLENSIIRYLDFYGTPVKLHLTRKIGK